MRPTEEDYQDWCALRGLDETDETLLAFDAFVLEQEEPVRFESRAEQRIDWLDRMEAGGVE